ncbi:MAG: hypothetical protein AAF619_12905 [Pseudomonadota bacterium]
MIKKFRVALTAGVDGSLKRALMRPFGWFFGFGYDYLKSARTIVLLWIIGWYLLGLSETFKVDVFANAQVPPEIIGDGITYCTEGSLKSLLTAINMSIPLLELGFESQCEIVAGFAPAFVVTLYKFAGWVFVPLAALTLSGLLKRE